MRGTGKLSGCNNIQLIMMMKYKGNGVDNKI